MDGNCNNGRVLIVDDEPNAIKVLSAILSEAGYDVLQAKDVRNAIGRIHDNEDVDAIITDLKMPNTDGMQFFQYISENHPDIPVIFLTAYGTVESAVYAMTNGAFYYFIKPPDYPKLKSILARAIEQHRLKRELERLRKRLSEEHNPHRITGKTLEMSRILGTLKAVKDSETSVLICGETGTGKELVAKALHYSSIRHDKPFIVVNCAAIPRELIESELFGYEKGAFTGAVVLRIGKFEEASGGTLFLDEIGELEPSLQVKLLRVLQEREIERIGASRKIKVKFRLVSSTNRDLKREIEAGNFREDLFYRINVLQIDIPPLRERKDDIPLLVTEFLNESCLREKKVLTVSDEVMSMFKSYSWPGNVRQLKNVIERAVVLARGDRIMPGELPEEFLSFKKQISVKTLKTLKELERQAVREALHECNGNKSKAAKILGISRKAFYKRLKDFSALEI
ncbi:MAG TPA: sigma-54-dependent Fis family transcriptional regulator [Nitrospirae bacterium]|nr:sigma-54-dependent Fis family transcriptional regulator [Nitrospirota bacterium]